MKSQKICIIGDGLAGLTTALSLAKLNIEIDLFYTKKKLSYKKDTRTTAISKSNFNFIKKIISLKNNNLFWPSKNINLFYENNKGYLNFLNYENANNISMYIFENEKIKKKIFDKLKKEKNVHLINKKILDIDNENSFLKLGNKKKKYDLIILCLGNNSNLYNSFYSRKIIKDYNEVAITCAIQHNIKKLSAQQYFLKNGPFAILPFKKNYFSLVWTLKKNFFLENEKKIKELTEQKLRNIFGIRKKFKISKIQSFPIRLSLRSNYHFKNTLILGEGIHSVHPIAGQGFNLVIRDIIKLKNLLKKNLQLGQLIRDSLILKKFKKERKPENIIFGLGIDMANTFFQSRNFFEPLKNKLLNNIKNNYSLKKVTEIISDKGLKL
ncbi:MAG: FAD-dependent monooxygenase [Pelagibacteraceae bacterium]